MPTGVYVRKPFSVEARANISAAQKGRFISAEHRAKISAALKGISHSGHPYSDETRARHGATLLRKHPVGSETVWYGRIRVKCANGRWRLRAVLVWETANGPVPKGHLIHHENEDTMDDCLENLRCMTIGQHSRHHLAKRRGRKAA